MRFFIYHFNNFIRNLSFSYTKSIDSVICVFIRNKDRCIMLKLESHIDVRDVERI